ncbi:MAG: HIT family protein [Deltaproteobacteria bacterium]|nr:HIT family protein [Deltaproteobacteria bacterium]MBW1951755.1 HIT family protein [Deltaproteobacteria bacterium]MBW1986849.1 HIT family protein [Deltaproteobacteria bacterium]MBW2134973.1 HIT family protein [Deltaproteobacteria bacterium]
MFNSDCIFCRIAAGRLSSVPILRTERVYAFLDIAPVHYGHTLVIPQDHYENLLDLPDDLWLEMGQVCRQVARALQIAFQAEGFNLGMNNFPAAGQVVFHAHLHVIPRFYDDDLHLFPQGEYRPGEMPKVGQKLRQTLASL